MKTIILLSFLLLSGISYGQDEPRWETQFSPSPKELIAFYLSPRVDTVIRGWEMKLKLERYRVAEIGLFMYSIICSKGDEVKKYWIWVSYTEEYLIRIELEKVEEGEL